VGSTGTNPGLETLMKYLVSWDLSVPNQSDADFSEKVVFRLALRFSKVGNLLNEWHISDGVSVSDQSYVCFQ
jgi:hypothetical protein